MIGTPPPLRHTSSHVNPSLLGAWRHLWTTPNGRLPVIKSVRPFCPSLSFPAGHPLVTPLEFRCVLGLRGWLLVLLRFCRAGVCRTIQRLAQLLGFNGIAALQTENVNNIMQTCRAETPDTLRACALWLLRWPPVASCILEVHSRSDRFVSEQCGVYFRFVARTSSWSTQHV